MKVVILAGGFGTRLSEETIIKPKPMTEIGEHPILWHIMKIYSFYGFNDFVILLGYKGYVIKEYFDNYFLHRCDVTIDLVNNERMFHNSNAEPWKVTLLETGLNTMTGGRIKMAKKYIGDEPFLLTYGDGVADVDIKALVDFHNAHGKAMTVTSVLPEGRFGALELRDNGKVENFIEKPKGDGSWINGGFFVCESKVFDYIGDNENIVFEKEPLQSMAENGEIYAYEHNGFWQCMDTLRDKQQLNMIWESKMAKWKKW